MRVYHFIIGILLIAFAFYLAPTLREYLATNAHLRDVVRAQNHCIQVWAEQVSKLDTTNERMCEFMVANRLICEIPVP